MFCSEYYIVDSSRTYTGRGRKFCFQATGMDSPSSYLCICGPALEYKRKHSLENTNEGFIEQMRQCNRMVMLIKENPLLVDIGALEKLWGVMDLISKQCVKQQDMTEILAMKMHINWVLQNCLEEHNGNLDILVKALTCQMGFTSAEFCTTCGDKGTAKRCSDCRMLRVQSGWFSVTQVPNNGQGDVITLFWEGLSLLGDALRLSASKTPLFHTQTDLQQRA
ncbi:sclerostin domain-containing protein 1b isoform X2 [Brienomyrus brachyistius]|uniref:sclerostin domain-containing protein 1b isoform X2 n=1 Tax=Brienomyrus brachyistius TaxID=42636 RepID=UPI0020B19511|nr:sclerostin domain-containing protein 1b isoform X2 [Brienomyrus brachyistius]